MSDAGFKAAARATVLKGGVPADTEKNWTYGWQVFDWDHNEKTLASDPTCMWRETIETEMIEYTFSEFNGTFTDNTDKTVLALTHVVCSCGKYKDTTIAIEGSVGDLLKQLLEDELDIKREHKW